MTEPHDTTRPEDEAREENAGEEARAPDTERPPQSLETTVETEPTEKADTAETQSLEALEAEAEEALAAASDDAWESDPERTVNLTGEALEGLPLRDDLENPPPEGDEGDRPTHLSQPPPPEVAHEVSRAHLKGLLEALVFVSDKPIGTRELAKAASSGAKEVKELLAELKDEYAPRGIQLDEVAGGWVFRTNAQYAPFVRDLTKQKPVKLTRAQVETLAILAYRQPITRPEIDEIRGVDSGATLKLLLERDLVKILGKKDEPGRPLLYGTTPVFLEFFGLKSLRDLPTLKEFTELNEDSRRVVERELGDVLDASQPEGAEAAPPAEGEAPAAEEGEAPAAEAATEGDAAPGDIDAERAAEAALEAEMELEAAEAEGDREAELPMEPRDTLPPERPIEEDR